jgi:SLT domain-containing protein
MTPSEFIFSVKSQLEKMPQSVEPLLNIFRGTDTVNEKTDKVAQLSAARQVVEKFIDSIPLEDAVARITELLQKDFCYQLLEQYRDNIPELF